MLQDRQGIPTGFPLHWSLADIVLPLEGEETALLPSAGSGTSAVRQTAVSQERERYELPKLRIRYCQPVILMILLFVLLGVPTLQLQKCQGVQLAKQDDHPGRGLRQQRDLQLYHTAKGTL
jgi:hypothetical protein